VCACVCVHMCVCVVCVCVCVCVCIHVCDSYSQVLVVLYLVVEGVQSCQQLLHHLPAVVGFLT